MRLRVSSAMCGSGLIRSTCSPPRPVASPSSGPLCRGSACIKSRCDEWDQPSLPGGEGGGVIGEACGGVFCHIFSDLIILSLRVLLHTFCFFWEHLSWP